MSIHLSDKQYADFFDMFFCIKLYYNDENNNNDDLEIELEKFMDRCIRIILSPPLKEYEGSFDNRLCATGIKDAYVIYEYCNYLYFSNNLIKFCEKKRIIYKKVFFLYVLFLFCIDKNEVLIKKLISMEKDVSKKFDGLENIVFKHKKKDFLVLTFIPKVRKMFEDFINSNKIIKVPTKENEKLVQQDFNQDSVCDFYVKIVIIYNLRISNISL